MIPKVNKQHTNVIISISLSVDDALRETIHSIASSGASKYFDVVIKLGSLPSIKEFTSLSNYCLESGVCFSILSDPDDGIYDAMNIAMAYARLHYDGYLWFVNSGDQCDIGINSFSQYLSANSSENNRDQLLIGGVNVYSESLELVSKFNYTGFPLAWFKPPLHTSIIFPSAYWHFSSFSTRFEVAGDIEFIYRALLRDFRVVSVFHPISSFYLGGLSSRRRSFVSALKLTFQRIEINISTIPFPYSVLVSIADAIRIIYRSRFSKV